MPATQFWPLHAGLCGTAGIIFLIADRLFGHLLAPGNNEILAVLTSRSLSGIADDRKRW